MSDAAAIRDVLRAYARGVDDCDWARVLGCYHADAHDDHGIYKGDPAGLVEHFRKHLDAYAGTLHLLGDPDLTAFGPDVIHALTACLALHWRHPGSGGRHLIMVADYDDRFERRRQSWRIARRTVRLRMAEEVPASAEPWPLLGHFAGPARPAR